MTLPSIWPPPITRSGKLLDYPELTNIADRTETKITFEEMIATGKIFIANFRFLQ